MIALDIDQKEIIHCSITTCGEVMIYDRQKEFWSCPRCGSEFWPNVRALSAIERERKSLERQEEERQRVRWMVGSWLYPDPLPAGRAKPGGGGSKSGGRKKRKKVAKKRPWELS